MRRLGGHAVILLGGGCKATKPSTQQRQKENQQKEPDKDESHVKGQLVASWLLDVQLHPAKQALIVLVDPKHRTKARQKLTALWTIQAAVLLKEILAND
ncbi:MAG: hypothetical protein ISR77_28995 [Pirellulaceae bacterium]|nr:hypothetical protein [Pirellulaceae bacterium]